MSDRFDIVFAGGGLANTLAACRIAQRHPDLRICLLESGAHLGAEHTWSFHSTDLTPAQLEWLDPFIKYKWERQEVRFPAFTRTLDAGYNSLTSQSLHHRATEMLGAAIRLNTRVTTINEKSVFTSSGEELRADCVFDGRGLKPSDDLALGYQTFLGLEVRLEQSHEQVNPIIMDATVDQLDGYRFVYTLPLAHDRMLIEDTYYNDTTTFDEAAIEARIRNYAASRGWTICEIVRREHGILPIVLAGHIDRFWDVVHASIPRTGLRAVLFHPVTGYSVPDAVRLADLLADQPAFSTEATAALIADHSRRHWNARAFYRLLNRMLFIAASPHERITVMQRFYRLPEPLIQRFYAGRTTLADQMRILVGKPPVSISKALPCLSPASAWDFARKHRSAMAATRDSTAGNL